MLRNTSGEYRSIMSKHATNFPKNNGSSTFRFREVEYKTVHLEWNTWNTFGTFRVPDPRLVITLRIVPNYRTCSIVRGGGGGWWGFDGWKYPLYLLISYNTCILFQKYRIYVNGCSFIHSAKLLFTQQNYRIPWSVLFRKYLRFKQFIQIDWILIVLTKTKSEGNNWKLTRCHHHSSSNGIYGVWDKSCSHGHTVSQAEGQQ